MRDGSAGKYGSSGNEESATYRFPDRLVGSNPTLTAILSSYSFNSFHGSLSRIVIGS
jgi:hypothetical protein